MKQLPAFDEISENLAFLDDWEDRYRYLIELGAALPEISEAERTPANKVSGCVSQVWLVVDADDDTTNSLSFRGDSDAMIVKGLVATLCSLYAHKRPAEIASIDAISILDELGLREHLTSQRSNGLLSMVERIKNEANARL